MFHRSVLDLGHHKNYVTKLMNPMYYELLAKAKGWNHVLWFVCVCVCFMYFCELDAYATPLNSYVYYAMVVVYTRLVYWFTLDVG